MRYVAGDIFCSTLNGPYLRGLSFLEGVLMWRLRAYNHTLSPEAKDRGRSSGLMHLCKAFCASVLDSCRSLSCACASGTASSGVVSDAVGLTLMINSSGVYLVCSCFQELCANSAIGRNVLQLFWRLRTN